MKFTLKTSKKFGWDGLEGWEYNSKEDFRNASAAFLEVTGQHGKSRTKVSDRVYYVVDGVGEFVIGGRKVGVAKSDVVIIPKNTAYDFRATEGTLKLFLVHTPAYVREK